MVPTLARGSVRGRASAFRLSFTSVARVTNATFRGRDRGR